jgi:hypothetical protein
MMREYNYGGLGLAALALAAGPARYALGSDPYDDLQEIRRTFRSRRKPVKRSISHRWGSKNTHRRERAKVAACRKANLRRMQAARRPVLARKDPTA